MFEFFKWPFRYAECDSVNAPIFQPGVSAYMKPWLVTFFDWWGGQVNTKFRWRSAWLTVYD
jgi:hypothetical protein